MELYVGGYGQEKLSYVLEQKDKEENCIVADGADCTEAELEEADIINHLHLFIRRQMLDKKNPQQYLKELIADRERTGGKLCLICDEIGMGIVPADSFERNYRECVGRCCCMFAEHADRVERIICKRGQRIK